MCFSEKKTKKPKKISWAWAWVLRPDGCIFFQLKAAMLKSMGWKKDSRPVNPHLSGSYSKIKSQNIHPNSQDQGDCEFKGQGSEK